MIQFICYPKCTSCQKARKWLLDKGIEFVERNIKEHNPSIDELRQWHCISTLPLKRFFNTSGLVYKSLNLSEKLPHMSEEEQYTLLATDGMLVKRPILITENTIITGFKESEWEKILITNP